MGVGDTAIRIAAKFVSSGRLCGHLAPSDARLVGPLKKHLGCYE